MLRTDQLQARGLLLRSRNKAIFKLLVEHRFVAVPELSLPYLLLLGSEMYPFAVQGLLSPRISSSRCDGLVQQVTHFDHAFSSTNHVFDRPRLPINPIFRPTSSVVSQEGRPEIFSALTESAQITKLCSSVHCYRSF